MATAADLIAQAEAATSFDEVDAIEALAEGRVTVLDAVTAARERLAQAEEEAEFEEGEAEAKVQEITGPAQNDWYGHTTEPDFVWVGCGNCWTPKDRMRPVLGYEVYLSDGHRRMNYICENCQQDVFPTL